MIYKHRNSGLYVTPYATIIDTATRLTGQQVYDIVGIGHLRAFDATELATHGEETPATLRLAKRCNLRRVNDVGGWLAMNLILEQPPFRSDDDEAEFGRARGEDAAFGLALGRDTPRQ